MSKLNNVDLAGKTFGKLWVHHLPVKKGNNVLWLCTCDCDNGKFIRQHDLLSGKTTHCGCERTYTKKSKVMPDATEVKLSFMQQFDKVAGYFETKRTDTLRDEAKQFVGKLLTFEALWKIDEDDGGPYVGQWAMRLIDENGDWLRMGWVPEEDITMKYITIKLTQPQAENLSDILNSTQDEGPIGEGWASSELEELRDIVDAEIRSAKNT